MPGAPWPREGEGARADDYRHSSCSVRAAARRQGSGHRTPVGATEVEQLLRAPQVHLVPHVLVVAANGVLAVVGHYGEHGGRVAHEAAQGGAVKQHVVQHPMRRVQRDHGAAGLDIEELMAVRGGELHRSAAGGGAEQERKREDSRPRRAGAPSAALRGAVLVAARKSLPQRQPRPAMSTGIRHERAATSMPLLGARAELEPTTASQHAQRGARRDDKSGDHAVRPPGPGTEGRGESARSRRLPDRSNRARIHYRVRIGRKWRWRGR